MGVPFEGRAARCASHIEVMRALWSESGEGAENLPPEIAGGVQEPYPIQQPHPPIYFGGNSRPAMRRVATYGQGWLPWELTPADAEEKLVTLTELLDERGRERGEILVSVATEAPAGGHRLRRLRGCRGRPAASVWFRRSVRWEEVDELFDEIESALTLVAAT